MWPRSAPLALAGAGMSAKLAEDVGARYLEDDPVTAAAARRARARGPLMARPDLTGWSSTERVSEAGAVAVRAARDLVAPARRALGSRRARTRGALLERGRAHDPPPRPRAPARRRDRAAPARPLDAAALRSTDRGRRRDRRPQPLPDHRRRCSPARRAARSRSPRPRCRPSELRATIDGFFPRLGGRPGGPAWTGALYRHVQQRIHTSISRRYFRRLIGEEPT